MTKTLRINEAINNNLFEKNDIFECFCLISDDIEVDCQEDTCLWVRTYLHEIMMILWEKNIDEILCFLHCGDQDYSLIICRINGSRSIADE